MCQIYIGIHSIEKEFYYLFFYDYSLNHILKDEDMCLKFYSYEDALWAWEVWNNFIDGKV